MDFVLHFAQDSPRFLPIYTILLGLLSTDYYLISMGILSIGNVLSNLFIKLFFKKLYSFMRVKTLPILGLGERPINDYVTDKVGYLDKYAGEAKLFGMPSGHSQSAWFFYAFGMLYLFDKTYKSQSRSNWVIITLLLMTAIAIFISYSRVYKNYHTTQQVILGGIIGFVMGVGGYILTKYIIDGRLSIKKLKEMIKII
jgi:membrane-associated phospholipid phosphatase